MQKRPTPIGEILTDLGRITRADIEHALAFQRERGGLFGDALVALGLLSPEEVRFALADQYGLPFVHLRPESIDRAVASLVPGEWAREHEMLPVLRDGATVTMITTRPPSAEELQAIQRFTRAERVEAAVSSPETLAVLIDAVHGEAELAAVAVPDWLAQALESGAVVWGITARTERTTGWFRTADGATVRVRLGDSWRDELEPFLFPAAGPRAVGPCSWPAVLAARDTFWRVECSAVERAAAAEYVVRVDTEIPALRAAAAPELRAAVRPTDDTVRTLRVLHTVDDGSAGVLEAMLPTLPVALLGERARALHLSDRPVAVPPGVLALEVADGLFETLASLEVFGLDALTLDVERLDPDHLEAARRVAPLVVFREPPTLSKRLRADLDVCLRGGSSPVWSLAS